MRTATSCADQQRDDGGAQQNDPRPPEGEGSAPAANDANMDEAASAAPADADAEPVGSKRMRRVMDPSLVERELKRVRFLSGKEVNKKRQKEDCDTLDDVLLQAILHVRRAPENDVVCDPEVIEYLKSSGHFAELAEQCWACAQPVCRECLNEYEADAMAQSTVLGRQAAMCAAIAPHRDRVMTDYGGR